MSECRKSIILSFDCTGREPEELVSTQITQMLTIPSLLLSGLDYLYSSITFTEVAFLEFFQ